LVLTDTTAHTRRIPTATGDRAAAAPADPAFDDIRYEQAVALFTEVALADNYADFLTIPAYERMP